MIAIVGLLLFCCCSGILTRFVVYPWYKAKQQTFDEGK